MSDGTSLPADHKARVQAQFGGSAAHYVASAGHAAGDDLDQLVAWAEGGPDRVALDVATGGGHTALALAPLYGRVVASDLTARMLAAAEAFLRERGATNVTFEEADAESLPFPDAAFDCVSCRIAPHHFGRPADFVREAARVLRPGGIFLLVDSTVPEDPALVEFLNHAEKLRDPTHVRSLTRAEWRGLAEAAGLAVEAEEVFRKTHALAFWLERARTPAATAREVTELFRTASSDARAAYAIEINPAGEVLSYTDYKLALKARKLSSPPGPSGHPAGEGSAG
ncbi:MAG TPA: methyltransferase domain-containing protein [Chloroflexota bacterium]|nr:methyltransferase domain-containing protein [Chloroflexota bacterium]